MPRYVWHGPAGAIEILDPASTDAMPSFVFSGPVASGREIPVDLPADNPQVATLVARQLLVEAPTEVARTKAKKEASTDG